MPFCQCVPLSKERYATLIDTLNVPIPLDQSTHWENLLADADPSDAAPALYFAIQRDGEVVAVVAFARHELRGQRYYWAKNGPVWLSAPSEQEEKTALNRLRTAIKSLDKKAVFYRALTHFSHKATRPVLQSLPYDHTVILDVRGGEEQLLARMKKRGRRDVRLALRTAESEGLQFSEIRTDRVQHFTELYHALQETAARDGFGIAPLDTYQNLLAQLGENIHLFTISTADGACLAWAIVMRYGAGALYYYAASTGEGQKLNAPDLMILKMSEALADMGVETLDMMGIGSDLAPSLSGVTTFKTKFSREVHTVASAKDIPIKAGMYRALVWARDAIRAARRFKSGPN